MPIVTYPEDPDILSESLTPALGYWHPAAGEVALDMINKMVGGASIRTYATGYIYYEGSIFTFYDGKEFDATFQNAKLHFLHALDSAHTGECLVILYDSIGRGAHKEFGTAPNAEWESKTFVVGPGAGWVEDAGFDWSHVKEIRFDCWEKYREAGSFWVDQPYFSYEEVKPTLRIHSIPTGKHYSIDGVSGYTPASYGLDLGSTYTVNMDPELFVKWENGSTNPSREISITVYTTITAYYEDAPPVDGPPQIADVAMFLGITAAIISIVGVIYSAYDYYAGD